MNWIEKAKSILFDNVDHDRGHIDDRATHVIDAMIEFAELVCLEQKIICADNAELGSIGHGRSHEYIVDKNSILNAPIVSFIEK